MLWVPPVRRRWKARKVKQRGISKVARGLFPEKGDRIEGIWVHGSSRLVSDLQKSGRNGHALGIGRKIMIKNLDGVLTPSTAGLVKRSDQFTAFGIDTDYGQAIGGVVLNLGSDVSKLLIALTGRGGIFFHYYRHDRAF